MVKTPRHSKPKREPVTIELEPGEVSRLTDEPANMAADTATPADSISAEPIVVETAPDATAAEPVKEFEAAAETPSGTGDPGKTDFGYDFPEEKPAASASARPMEPGATSPSFGSKPAAGSTPAAERKPSVLAPLAAALAGGVIALAGAGLVQWAMGGGSSSGVPSLDGVNGEIAALKSEIAGLKGSTAPDPRVDALSQAVEQTKAEITSLRESLASAQPGDPTAMQAFDARLKQIESTVTSLGQGGASASDVAALGERVSGVEALAKSADEQRAAIDSRVGAVEQSVQALTAKIDAQAAQPRIALSIAAAALKSAIDRGVPFTAEVDTFAAIAPNVPELATLKPYAETGVATRADLIAGIGDAAKVIVAAANPPDPNAGFFDRLLSSAEQLVSVRPIGEVEGEGVPQMVARMEVAVRAGDLAKALAEYDRLPDAAKAAGAPYADKLKARLDVERLADQAIAAAMKAA